MRRGPQRARARRPLLAILGALAVAALAPAPGAAGDLADQTALAERYAPVVRLVRQEEECGPGEPYRPLDVDLLFGAPTVALRGPWGGGDLVAIGPSAKELSRGLYEYHLDFPGNALEPGCDYERWARRIAAGHAPAIYAHVATDPEYPGRLALQYWIFYAYNDWNNLHEGDWEMIQLDFDAATAAEALSREPTSVGYSQHEGAERAGWGSDKLEIVDGTHPVVHPAAGSHANFYGEALHIGSSADQGVGCDDTRGPTVDVRPTVFTIPSDAPDARKAFPWIAFEGRWGELQPAFFNGPTGPNLKTQWTAPIQWSEGWRDRSYAVPVGGAVGTEATDFFCTAVGTGSRTLVRLVNRPLEVALAIAALVLVVLFALSRTSWRPVAPLRVARRRSWGQTLAAASAMYVRRLPLFVGLGLLLIPISLLVALAQQLLVGGTDILGIQPGGNASGALGFVALATSTSLTLLGLGLVQAATARALVELDQGRDIGPLRAYRLAADSLRPVLGALVIAVAIVSLLSSTLYLVPVAVWLAGRWSLIAPAAELEELSALGALRRSSGLVRRRWLKVSSLIVLGAALALAAGPIVGALLIIVSSAPLWLANLVAGVLYAVTMPLVALTTAYVYFDTRARDELAPETATRELPAEIELSS
jgi:hypothetical protein